MGISSKVRKASIILSFVGGSAMLMAGFPVTTGVGIGLILAGIVLLWVDSIANGSSGHDTRSCYVCEGVELVH